MQKLFQMKFQPSLPNPYCINASKPTSSFGSFRPSNRTQIRSPIICAKTNKNWGLFGSQKSRKSVLQFVHFVALNFNVLPEPWNSLVRQFGGGGVNGGGSGSGFGKGFFGWGGRGRGKKRKLGFWGIVLMGIALGVWLLLGKEVGFHVFVGTICVYALMVVANLGMEWVLGFCCGIVLVGLGMRREDLRKWVKGFRVLESGRRRNRRRSV